MNISTDKAADPISILGKSKLLSERLTATMGKINPKTRYMSVRFGNVFGSRGSVLHTFRRQIELGGPITLTDMNVTRYFMTVEEAIHLVIFTASNNFSGETIILKMGEPIKILEIAEKLISACNKDIKIEVRGLMPGEKLHEQLIGKNESILESNFSDLIRIKVDPLPIEKLDDLTDIKIRNLMAN